ncbi:MAG: type IV pilus secretin PilQ [Thermoanaerobaculia bacterium]|nr:type IV pilus secretin PilQ [Thermoanaerobaculia bacterium]
MTSNTDTRRRPRRGSAWRAVLALVLATSLFGCSSARQDVATSGDTSGSDTVASAQVRQPAEIVDLSIDESEEGASIRVDADRSLVWTSFRNTEGDLVIELPNSRPAAMVTGLEPAAGLVGAVEVESLDDGERPMTRMTVRTRQTSEHSLSSEGNALILDLMAIAGAGDIELAYEPIEEEDPSEVASYEEAASEGTPSQVVSASNGGGIPQTYGTPDAPQVGPAPTGVAATQLYEVMVEERNGATAIEVAGDGEFAYSTFRLQNPDRFVLDLEGVVNSGARSTIPVGSGQVQQIRIGQFKPRPEPVARVVFDLSIFETPVVARTSTGLVISFGSADFMPETAVASQADTGEEPVEVANMADAGTQTGDDYQTTEETYSEPPTMVAETSDSEYLSDDSTGTADSGSTEIPVYQPPAAPPRPAAGGEDVALFEAQQVDANDPEDRRDRILESFGSVVVSRNDREYVGEPISMSLRNADLVETLRSFAKISDLNLVIQPGVRGSVTVELNSVPWDQAMEQILKINNLGMDIDGTIVRIAPLDQLQSEAAAEARLRKARAESIPLRTVMRSLSYARAQTVASVLRRSVASQLLSRRATIEVYQPTNTLVISEVPDRIDTVLAVIDNLDVPEPQVTIESRIVEANKNFSRTLGIQWGYNYTADQENGNTTGLIFPNNVQSDGGVGLLTGGANGFLNLAMGNILDTFRLNARLQVAENEGLINVVSAPRVTTLNNSPASIQSGFQIPVQTVSDRTISVQYINATLQLRVTPQVTAEGTVLLELNIAKRTPVFALQVPGATGVPLQTKDASTRVLVRDGATAVIAGIYEIQTDQGEDRVPGLANVPILGYLFRNKDRNDLNTELMIFITPRIVQL